MPGWDEWTKEVARKLAHHGYAAIAPHLFSRHGPGARDDVAAARARRRRRAGRPGRWATSPAPAHLLRQQPYANGKVGVIGFCSGGRQAYLPACTVARHRRRGRLLGRPGHRRAGGADAQQPRAPIDMTPRLRCPLLGHLRQRRRQPRPGAGQSHRGGAQASWARTTSSTATTAPATASSPPTGRTIAPSRPSTAGRRCSRSSSSALQVEAREPVQPPEGEVRSQHSEVRRFLDTGGLRLTTLARRQRLISDI